MEKRKNGGYSPGRPRRPRNPQKYHNQKIKVDGMTFDSVREFRRWNLLMLLQERGEIRNLKRQVSFPLLPAQFEPSTEVYKRGPHKGEPKRGKCLERALSYVADFVYEKGPEDHPETVVEDAKGVRTEAYMIKRKLMLYTYGIRLEEV